jgi:flagellar biosynthesis/type III secretory pathway chaperone
MNNISLIETGEAKGHGVQIDRASLESALSVIDKKVPAFLTHSGAMDDRILQQIGFFQGFYIDESGETFRLIAEKFVALESFKSDEPEKYRRLFDIAENIPETFGVSLVFDCSLVWKTKDGKEIEYSEQPPENVIGNEPFVRFIEIKSADFVDEPAANEQGLFSSNIKNQIKKLMTSPTQLAEDDEKVEEPEAEQPEAEVEETEAEEETEEVKAEAEGESTVLDFVAEIDARVAQLESLIPQLTEAMSANKDALTAMTETFDSIKKLSKGHSKPVTFSKEETPEPSIHEKFMNASTAKELNELKPKLFKSFKA